MMNSMSQSQLFEDNPLQYDYSEDIKQQELDDLYGPTPSFVTFDDLAHSSSLHADRSRNLYRNPIGIHNRPDYIHRYPSPPPPEPSIYDKVKDYFVTVKELIAEILEYTSKRNL